MGGSIQEGVPSPCFWDHRIIYHGGTKEGFIWFYSTRNTHYWDLDTLNVIGPSGPTHGVWPMAKEQT